MSHTCYTLVNLRPETIGVPIISCVWSLRKQNSLSLGPNYFLRPEIRPVNPLTWILIWCFLGELESESVVQNFENLLPLH